MVDVTCVISPECRECGPSRAAAGRRLPVAAASRSVRRCDEHVQADARRMQGECACDAGEDAEVRACKQRGSISPVPSSLPALFLVRRGGRSAHRSSAQEIAVSTCTTCRVALGVCRTRLCVCA